MLESRADSLNRLNRRLTNVLRDLFELELLTKYGGYFGALQNDMKMRQRVTGLEFLHHNYVTNVVATFDKETKDLQQWSKDQSSPYPIQEFASQIQAKLNAQAKAVEEASLLQKQEQGTKKERRQKTRKSSAEHQVDAANLMDKKFFQTNPTHELWDVYRKQKRHYARLESEEAGKELWKSRAKAVPGLLEHLQQSRLDWIICPESDFNGLSDSTSTLSISGASLMFQAQLFRYRS